jgi:surface protein
MKDKEHLTQLMKKEIELRGFDCDLNHLDVRNVADMSYLFYGASFKGDISNWDVSRVENMEGMFLISTFNGDVSKWDVSNVKNMKKMFHFSQFNKNLSNWKPVNLENSTEFCNTERLIPYWAKCETIEERRYAIEKYNLPNELNESLPLNNHSPKKKGIKI